MATRTTLPLEFAILDNSLERLESFDVAGIDYDAAVALVKLLLNGKYEDVLRSEAGQSILATNLAGTEELPVTIQDSVATYISNGPEGDNSARSLSVLCVGIASLQLFVQNNWVGPPSSMDPTNLLPESLQQTDKKQTVSDYIENSLTVDGEPHYNLTTHPLLLVLARILLQQCQLHLTSCQTSTWWWMRCCWIHQALLEERSPTLKTSIQESIDTFSKLESIMADEKNRSLLIQFNIEAGYAMYFYYEPAEAQKNFSLAKEMSGLKAELTGAKGKRTRYQKKDLSQLVLQVERKGEPTVPSGESTVVAVSEENEEDIKRRLSYLPKDVNLDDDTVLNQINFTDSDQIFAVQMSAIDQSLVLAMCHEHRKTREGVGDILREESLAFVDCVLGQPQNWSVVSSALLLRTYWESDSVRRMERTLAQLEELVSQHERPTENPADRLHCVYTVKLPPKWQLKRELGQLLTKIGAMKAALDVYLSLHMWEDVIMCHQSLGSRGKAEQVIREQMAIKETPSLWCHLGDVLQEEEPYLKSWELSNHRFSRAQKALGYLHLQKGRFEECLPCFEKTLALNGLQVGVWFSYGCASLAVSKYDIAATAFRRCVLFTSENFEAWNNLATAYIRSNQKHRAFNAFQEALKCDYENWRIWENYLLVAVDIGQFEESIRAYHRMLDKKNKYGDSQVLGVLVKAVVENLNDANEIPSGRLREKLLRLMGRTTAVVTTDAEIWRLYAKLLTEGTTEVSQVDRERALQYLQKSHRCVTQAPGWEKDLEKCKDVANQSVNLAKTYVSISEQVEDSVRVTQMLSSAKLMLKGVTTKIRKEHTNPATQELVADLAEPCLQLDAELQNIIDAITSRS